jgi:hypothetical protein
MQSLSISWHMETRMVESREGAIMSSLLVRSHDQANEWANCKLKISFRSNRWSLYFKQTSFIVEWHKSVHQKNGVNSLLEYHQHLLQNILKCGGALWRMTPKNYELGGVYNTNNIQCHFFPGGKMAHKQRIVKWMTSQNAKVLPLFYTQFWFLNLYVEVNKFHVFISYMFSIFSPVEFETEEG